MALVCLLLAGLQAWDSHVLSAEPYVVVMAAIAIALVPAAIVGTAGTHVHLAAAAIGGALLALARLLSAVHLPELVLAAFFPGLLVLFNHVRVIQARSSGAARS